MTVGYGIFQASSSSSPPPPGGNGKKPSDSFKLNASWTYSEFNKLIIMVVCFLLHAAAGFIFGIRCLINPRNCGEAGAFGWLHGVSLCVVAACVLAVFSGIRNARSCMNRRGLRSENSQGNLERRMVSCGPQTASVSRIWSFIAAIFLFISGIAFMVMAGICVGSIFSSARSRTDVSGGPCFPIAMMDISSSMVEIGVAIGLVVSLFLGSLSQFNGGNIQPSSVDKEDSDDQLLLLLDSDDE